MTSTEKYAGDAGQDKMLSMEAKIETVDNETCKMLGIRHRNVTSAN